MAGKIIPLSMIVNTALHTSIQQPSNGEKIVIISHPLPKLGTSSLLFLRVFSLNLCITFISGMNVMGGGQYSVCTFILHNLFNTLMEKGNTSSKKKITTS